MSNIAVQNRTDADAANAIRAARLVAGAAVFALLLVSFTPFVLEYDAAANGNPLNQIGYSALAILALAGHVLFTDRAVAASLLRPAWLLMIACLFLSVLSSYWPDAALRAVLFTVMAMIAGTGALCLPANIRDFRVCLAVAALAVLLLSYFGVLAYPAAAIHGGEGPEPQHAGLWRGIYSHKNMAGPVMALLLFSGLYLMRCGERWLGLLIALLAGFFVYKTGSKTTLGLIPVVWLIVSSGRLVGARLLPVLVLLLGLATTFLFTLGAAVFPALDRILQSVAPGTTFTGRMDLWRFTLNHLQYRQWVGFGFESFWGTNHVYKAEVPFELSWDPRLIVNAHSGYLDIAVWGGWPMLGVAVLVLMLLPFRDYLKVQPAVENRRLADFLLMVLAFVLLNSFFESYLLSRAQPIWMFAWIAIVGLRLASRFRLG